MLAEVGTLSEPENRTRRKTDRYARPNDDHDLLTQLWTMFLHNCDEQRDRHSENARRIEELRKEQAEARAATNYRVDALERDIKTKFETIAAEITQLQFRGERQLGAWGTARLVGTIMLAAFVAAGAGATVVGLFERGIGH